MNNKVCAICGKVITGQTYEAELSMKDDQYYAQGVPAGHSSQGWFDIGPKCYNKHVEKETPRTRGRPYYDRERDLW